MKTVQMGPLSTFKQRATQLALGLGLAATLAFGAVMPALAADPVIVVQAGSLSISSTPTIVPTGTQTAIVRDGTDHNRTFTVNSIVTDYRQAPDTFTDAAGWNVNISMGEFLDGAANMGTTATPTASITKVAASSTSAAEVTSDFGPSALENQIAGAASLTPGGAAGLDTAKVFSAATAHGVGVYTFTPTVTVTVPAAAAPGTYTSLLTVSVDTAP
jgi:hypothetical protein